VNRTLKFIYAKYDKTIPAIEEKEILEKDHAVLKAVWAEVLNYIQAFDSVEIKKALKITMEISHIANKYIQDEAPWDSVNFESGRSKAVLFIAGNLIRLISGLFEPFLPSFSAKVNYILNITREEKDEYFVERLVEANRPEALAKLISGGHKLNKPVPLFAEIGEDDVENYREKYKG